MGICCAKNTEEKSVNFSDITGNDKGQNGSSADPKKENKRYTQDPTIPRNTTEPQSPGMLQQNILFIRKYSLF